MAQKVATDDEQKDDAEEDNDLEHMDSSRDAGSVLTSTDTCFNVSAHYKQYSTYIDKRVTNKSIN